MPPPVSEPTASAAGLPGAGDGERLMRATPLDGFAVAHGALAGSSVAIDPTSTWLGFVSSAREIATRVISAADAAGENEVPTVTAGPSFTLPADLAARAFAIAPDGTSLALVGSSGRSELVVTVDASGEVKRSNIHDVAKLPHRDLTGRALTFDRSGAYLWISADGFRRDWSPHPSRLDDLHDTEIGILVLVDARTHDVLAVLRGKNYPTVVSHELYVHPSEESVLLLAACYEHDQLARVARWPVGDPRSAALVACAQGGHLWQGEFVGFSPDAACIYLFEIDVLRVHRWPDLAELGRVSLVPGEMASHAWVAIVGDSIVVDGSDRDFKDVVMAVELAGTSGTRIGPPFPTGASLLGRLGDRGVVTLEKGSEPDTLVARVTWLSLETV